MASQLPSDPIDALLSAHGLRRTVAARLVLGWLLAHPDTSYTHAQLQAALVGADADAPGVALDRVTLYRLIDRLTLAGLLLCRVDASRVRQQPAQHQPRGHGASQPVGGEQGVDGVGGKLGCHGGGERPGFRKVK